MTFSKWILVYVATVVAFLAIDMVWLSAISRDFYRRNLGDLMAPKVNWPVAIAFYLLYVFGALILVVWPAFDASSLGRVIVLGALLGLVAYGTYDLTNLATTRGWPANVAVVDMMWGGVLTAATSTVGYLVAKALA